LPSVTALTGGQLTALLDASPVPAESQAWRSFKPGRDIDAIAHQVTVALLHNVAEVDGNPKLDPALRRQASVAHQHAGLHLDRVAHRIDPTAELDVAAVPGALDDTAVMGGHGRVDEIAAEAA